MEAYRKIGQRVNEWCRQHGIPVSTYYSWQRKVFQAAVSENEVRFVEVSVRPAVAETVASIECGALRGNNHTGGDPETIPANI